jgi:hypothetical protein
MTRTSRPSPSTKAVPFDAALQAVLLAAPLLAACFLGGCSPDPSAATAAIGPNTPGFTGRTVVPGNNSTIAGNAEATEMQQKWPLGRNR